MDDMTDKDLLKDDPMHEATKVYLCRLPSCNNTFTEKDKKIERQEFCCPDHQTQFWILARRLGKLVMDEIQQERKVEK